MWGGMTDHDHLSIADTDPAELAEQREADAKAHRLAHELRDPKFYTARTKRAVNSGGVR